MHSPECCHYVVHVNVIVFFLLQLFHVFTVKLAKDHAKNVESYEKKRQTQMKERQEAFQEAFNEDVDYFREHGRLDRKYRWIHVD